jgi:hypothetical protein
LKFHVSLLTFSFSVRQGKAAGSNMPSQGQGSPGNVMMGKMGEAAANEGN